jgi:hypothetical protein
MPKDREERARGLIGMFWAYRDYRATLPIDNTRPQARARLEKLAALMFATAQAASRCQNSKRRGQTLALIEKLTKERTA